jgi:uncharacterized protein YbaR (Trm112 family)
MLQYIGIRLEISTECKECRQPLPVNGVTKKLLCNSCQREIDIPPDIWQFAIGDAIPGIVNLNVSDSFDTDEDSYGLKVKVKYKRQSPRCIHENCKAPFSETELQKAVESEGLTALCCSKCGLTTHAQKPPDWFTKLVHPSVVLLVSENQITENSKSGITDEIVEFNCPHCGAPLSVDGTGRKMICSYCNNMFMIPDNIWLKLHPATVMKPWYLVLDLTDFAGITPTYTWEFDDIVIGPEENIALLYHSTEKSIVSLANRAILSLPLMEMELLKCGWESWQQR